MESATLPPSRSPRWSHAPPPSNHILSERRVGDGLPPLHRPDHGAKDTRETAAGEGARTASSAANSSSISTTLTSPSSMYPGPPPPYSYHSSANPRAAGPNGYISPPDSQRTSVDDKDQARQSLPSISEALGNDPGILYPPAAPPSVQIPAPAGSATSHASSVSPTNPVPRSHPEPGLHGPPNPYASAPGPPPYNHDTRDGKMQPPYRQGSQSEDQARRNGPELTPQSNHPSSTISPIQTQGHSPRSLHHAQSSPSFTAPNQPVQAPPYRTFQAPYSYPSPAASSFAAVNSYNPPQQWRGEAPDADDPRKAAAKLSPGGVQHYGESVKRHLDSYDLETSLNEMAEGCGRGLDFARHFGNRAHQTQRSGPTLASLPSHQECEEMFKLQERVLISITRIRDVVIAQQTAMAEQRSRDEVKAKQEYPDDSSSTTDKAERGGGFAGPDPKKRRGRNAPPGRCHSCNRAETPEWRRGPDGARTLCNACGLHYAKITRKHGQKAGMTSSNLRPKDGEGQ